MKKAIPSLKQFIQRQQVLKQYRRMMRACFYGEENEKRDDWMMGYIRDSYKSKMHETDYQKINRLIAYGAEEVKTVEKMVPKQEKNRQQMKLRQRPKLPLKEVKLDKKE